MIIVVIIITIIIKERKAGGERAHRKGARLAGRAQEITGCTTHILHYIIYIILYILYYIHYNWSNGTSICGARRRRGKSCRARQICPRCAPPAPPNRAISACLSEATSWGGARLRPPFPPGRRRIRPRAARAARARTACARANSAVATLITIVINYNFCILMVGQPPAGGRSPRTSAAQTRPPHYYNCLENSYYISFSPNYNYYNCFSKQL